MEEFSVEREQLYSKINDLECVVNLTRENNRRNFHEKDLEITVVQDRLYKEMLGNVMELAAEFRKATKQQLGKMEMRTLEKNVELSQRLSDMGTKLLDMFGTNKSFQQATNELEKDVQILRELRETMKKKLKRQTKNLQVIVRDCYEKGDILNALYEVDKNEFESDKIQSGDHEAYLTKLTQKEANLKHEVEQLEHERANLQICHTVLKQDAINESNRLNQLRIARNRLSSLIRDVCTALKEALEIFDPENTSLNLTERSNRQDRLLASLFILLYTSDQLHNRITPNSIGDYRISILSGSKYHKLFHSPLTSHDSEPNMSRSTGQLDRSFGKMEIHTICRTPHPSLNEVDSYSHRETKSIHNSGILQHFGLTPFESNFEATIRKLSQQLSATSRKNRIITPHVRSLAIQVDLENKSGKSQSSWTLKSVPQNSYIQTTQRGIVNDDSLRIGAWTVHEKLLLSFPAIKLTCSNITQNEKKLTEFVPRPRILKSKKNPQSDLPSLKLLAMI